MDEPRIIDPRRPRSPRAWSYDGGEIRMEVLYERPSRVLVVRTGRAGEEVYRVELPDLRVRGELFMAQSCHLEEVTEEHVHAIVELEHSRGGSLHDQRRYRLDARSGEVLDVIQLTPPFGG